MPHVARADILRVLGQSLRACVARADQSQGGHAPLAPVIAMPQHADNSAALTRAFGASSPRGLPCRELGDAMPRQFMDKDSLIRTVDGGRRPV